MSAPEPGDVEIRHMADPDGTIRNTIAGLAPHLEADETPRGRLAGIERDEWLTYREMYDLLTGAVVPISPGAYEQALRDLAGQLCDLHRRGAEAFEAVQEATL